MMKSGLGKIFLKFLHALTMSFLLLNFDQKYKFSNKNNMVSAWRNFKNIFPRPLFIIIFRPEVLKFHPYSILTGDTIVGFVIFCVLIQLTDRGLLVFPFPIEVFFASVGFPPLFPFPLWQILPFLPRVPLWQLPMCAWAARILPVKNKEKKSSKYSTTNFSQDKCCHFDNWSFRKNAWNLKKTSAISAVGDCAQSACKNNEGWSHDGPFMVQIWSQYGPRMALQRPQYKFFIMSTEFDKNISDWSHFCTDHKNGNDFFMSSC